MSWYIYLDAIGWAILFLFVSAGAFLLTPLKFSLAWIPASIVQAIAWFWILHVTLFARSYQTYRIIDWRIEWPVFAAAVVLGMIGIIMSRDVVLYWENHKKRGNWQRWPAVHKSNLDQDLKNKLFDELTEEYYKVNRMI